MPESFPYDRTLRELFQNVPKTLIKLLVNQNIKEFDCKELINKLMDEVKIITISKDTLDFTSKDKDLRGNYINIISDRT